MLRRAWRGCPAVHGGFRSTEHAAKDGHGLAVVGCLLAHLPVVLTDVIGELWPATGRRGAGRTTTAAGGFASATRGVDEQSKTTLAPSANLKGKTGRDAVLLDYGFG